MVQAADLTVRWSDDEHVVVLARFGRDASVVSDILSEGGIGTEVVHEPAALIACLRRGVGAVLLTAESLSAADVAELMRVLAEQPSWSDVPVLVLVAEEYDSVTSLSRHLEPNMPARNLLVLQRPLPAITLLTAVRSALQARRRQYEVRALIARERFAREQAEAATRVKDEFLAVVSHELRTPLNAILIWAHLLEAGRLTGAQAEDAIQTITSSAESQSKLIEDLLDVSRMLMGKLRLQIEERELGPILLAALDVVRPMADAKGVHIHPQLEQAAVRVWVDTDRAQQIFWNLLSNAVKFTPPAGSVWVTCLCESQHVSVQVRDTGEGIDPEFLPHLFERFRQADAASTRRQSGLGLGLSIVHQLLELHGGTISAFSAGKGLGSTFTVRLPLAHAPTASPASD
jgi:signal transduction histidine kinase